MAIEVPKIQDEVAEFLKRFRRENSFASGLARDKFLDAMNRLPSDKKVEFITAYLNNPTAAGAASSALVAAISEARGQVAEEVLASALKNYGRRLSEEDRRALIDSVLYSANEATANALAALAKEAGVEVSGPVRQALTTRVGLTMREAAPTPSGERRTLMVPSTPPPTRTEAPEDKATVSYTGQEVWFAPEDKKQENPIRVGVKLADNPDFRADLEKRKDLIQKQLTLIRIKAGASRLYREAMNKLSAEFEKERRLMSFPPENTPERAAFVESLEKNEAIRRKALEDRLVGDPNTQIRKLEELNRQKEQEYGIKTPAELSSLRDLEIELGHIEESLRRGVVGGYIPVNPNAGLKRVKAKVKKEVVRGRGKKRGPVIETVEETIYVPKEIVGPEGSRESIFAATTRRNNALRQQMNLIESARQAAGGGIDPELLEKAAGLVKEAARVNARGGKFEIPAEYEDAVKYYVELRRMAELEVKASTPVSGMTRIAKGNEFQRAEEARAFNKAMKAGPSRVRDMLLAENISKLLPVDTEFVAKFRAAGFESQMAAAQKLFKKLSRDVREEIVGDIADRNYAPFRWTMGPSGVVAGAESVQADSKTVTMLDQKPEMYPRVSASQRLGGARRSDEPSSSWVNLDLFRAGRKLKPQQRLAQSVYLNPDWISATFGTEALKRVVDQKVGMGETRAPETSITRWDLAQAGYNPYGEEADVSAADVPVTMFARATDAWEKNTFRRRNENVVLPHLIMIGQGENRRLVPANSPEGKRFLIQTNATAYLYGGNEARSLKLERKQEKELIDLAEEMVAEDLIGEGFDPDQNAKLFYQKLEELVPLRLNVLLLDGPLVSQNLIDAAGLYNERLRSKFVAPKQAVAGGLKATPVRAAPKSDEAIRAEAAERVTGRYFEKMEGMIQRPPTVDQIFERLKESGWVGQLRGRTEKAMRALAVRQYNAAVQNYAQQYDALFQKVADNYDEDLKEEERRLRAARGVVGFKRTKEEAEKIRRERKLMEAQERAREQELEAAREAGERQLRETLARERGVSRRDPTKEGKLPFILSEEKTPETEIAALQQEKRIKGSAFPGFKEKRLRKLLAQQRIAIEKKGMSGLGAGFGSYDLGSQIAGVAVGGLVVFSLFKAIQAGLKKA